MTGHQQVQQPTRMSKLKQKHKGKQDLHQKHTEPPPTPPPGINVDELAREKVEEVERSLKELTSFKLEAFNSWFSLLKQIISAADLHRTNDGRDKENGPGQQGKSETGDSIYADYGDDNEQFTAHVDLSEQFATNSVKWTIRVQAFKIVHRLVRLLLGSSQVATSSNSTILERYLPDLVRLAFVAATSPYDELKMQGFEMFKFLIERFASVEEREFPGHSILEQYKTQVLSAVKPAFNLDAPPYITAIASQICSLWICRGLEKEPSDIKRTYQLMLLSIEKLEGQSENQHSKLYTESELEQERVDILGSWAQLYVASLESDLLPSHCGRMSTLTKDECLNLNQLVEPQLAGLVDKWWEALKDYALLIMPAPKFIGTSMHDNENVYTREVALRLFAPTWPKLVLALSVHLQSKDDNQEDDQTTTTNATASSCESSPNKSSNNSDCDASSPRRRRVSKTKYAKFLCGILMKELSRCLISEETTQRTQSPLAESTSLALKSLHLLVLNSSTNPVFTDDLTIAQEFYTTLYGITVAHGRSDESNRQLMNETLDLLFTMTLKRVASQRISIQYAVAKLVSSLMTSMKNIEIGCRQKSAPQVDLHRRHLVLKLRNLLTLVKAAPHAALEEVPLQEALIAVFQEMLRFDQEVPSVSLCLASQLETLYSALECEEHRTHMIEELFPDLCKRAEASLSALIGSKTPPNSTTDKLKISHTEAFLAACRAAISHSSKIGRVGLIDQCIGAVLRPLSNVISQRPAGQEDAVAASSKQSGEFVDYCLGHVNKVQETFPDEFQELDSSSGAKLLYDSASKWQQDSRHQLELRNKKLQESKRATSAKSQANKPTATKITLKADFSNFYTKKT